MSVGRESQFIKIPKMVATSIETRTWLLRRRKFRRAVRLLDDLVFYSSKYDYTVVVPKGYISDGATVPQVFWSMFPPFGQYLESAVVHDWLSDAGNAGDSDLDSADVHAIFHEAMMVQGISLPKRNSMWSAVRVFGPRFSAKK